MQVSSSKGSESSGQMRQTTWLRSKRKGYNLDGSTEKTEGREIRRSRDPKRLHGSYIRSLRFLVPRALPHEFFCLCQRTWPNVRIQVAVAVPALTIHRFILDSP